MSLRLNGWGREIYSFNQLVNLIIDCGGGDVVRGGAEGGRLFEEKIRQGIGGKNDGVEMELALGELREDGPA